MPGSAKEAPIAIDKAEPIEPIPPWVRNLWDLFTSKVWAA
ncbi:unnamed protein product, partial [marine sediment metagenome]